MVMILLVTLACASPPERREPTEILAPFKKDLMSALMKAMLEGGPETAIDVCRLKAPSIAASAGSGETRVGRTSHRIRNPANAPEPWMAPLLEAYLADPTDRDPRTVTLDSGEVGYVEPIHVKPICLNCHGEDEDLDTSVTDQLRRLYPEDQATGFREGDFRGIFWVVMPGKEG
jgi:hypothetical protein